MKVVFTGGFFNIIHRGHIRLFREARSLGDKLIVGVHRDECCLRFKGYCVLNLEDKVEVLSSIKWVDEVWVCSETCDGSTVEALEKLRKLYPNDELVYAKGGDRKPENMPKNELETCERLNIKIVYGVGGSKVQSSSWLVEKVKAQGSVCTF